MWYPYGTPFPTMNHLPFITIGEQPPCNPMQIIWQNNVQSETEFITPLRQREIKIKKPEAETEETEETAETEETEETEEAEETEEDAKDEDLPFTYTLHPMQPLIKLSKEEEMKIGDSTFQCEFMNPIQPHLIAISKEEEEEEEKEVRMEDNIIQSPTFDFTPLGSDYQKCWPFSDSHEKKKYENKARKRKWESPQKYDIPLYLVSESPDNVSNGLKKKKDESDYSVFETGMKRVSDSNNNFSESTCEQLSDYIKTYNIPLEVFPLHKMESLGLCAFRMDLDNEINYFIFYPKGIKHLSVICQHPSPEEKHYSILCRRHDSKIFIKNTDGNLFDLASFTELIKFEMSATPLTESKKYQDCNIIHIGDQLGALDEKDIALFEAQFNSLALLDDCFTLPESVSPIRTSKLSQIKTD